MSHKLFNNKKDHKILKFINLFKKTITTLQNKSLLNFIIPGIDSKKKFPILKFMSQLISVIILQLLLVCPLIKIFADQATCITHSTSNPRNFLLEKLAGEWLTQCIYSATELDIAAHLMNGPKSIDELATKSNTQPDLLYRLMNFLASNGIFHELEGKTFANNEVSLLLSTTHPQSLYDITLFFKEIISPNWSHLTNTLISGIPSFELHNQKPVFQYFKENPSAASQFNAAMKSKSNAVIASLLKIYDFSNFSKLYDIGGGQGHFAYAILNHYPQLSATIFELPEVIESAKTKIPSPLESRCSFVSGNFFNEIPSMGDIYFLKSIIHDWSDSEALKILKNCHKAMPNHARLLIIEPILLGPNTPDYAKSMDLLMMTITGGRERSLEEMQNLLNLAGFTLINILPTDTEFSILEFSKNI